MHIILAALWCVPVILRTWRMARFYQIEEYKSNRFAKWLISKQDRWFYQAAGVAMLVGVIVSFVLQLADINTPILHFALWTAVALFISRPEPVKETKKEFSRTSRATRMLGASFAVGILFVLVGALLAGQQDDAAQTLSTVAIIGYIGFLLAPVTLMAGNALMFPVEGAMRGRFYQKAQQRLEAAAPFVIGITGSYGKTSTKHYLAHILGGKHKVYPTPKSYNTIMGTCLAINNDLDPNYGWEYFISEMGAYRPGEVAGIAKLTKPKISIVTAVGPMHLERFKTLENIVTAKYEIVAGLPPDGTAIFNGDNPYVLEMARRGYPENRIIVSYEELPEARWLARDILQTVEGLRFTVYDREQNNSHPFVTHLLGMHNVTNILLATAAAHAVGLTLPEIGLRVSSLAPAEHRLNHNVLPNGVTVIDDAYSANPVGVISALEVLALHDEGRRVVITPGMIELGRLQEEENYKLGQRLPDYATDVVLVGIEQTRPLQDGIATTDFDKLLVVDTFDEARQWFQSEVGRGDAVLFLNDLPDTYL